MLSKFITAAACTASVQAAAPKTTNPPHIFFVVVDDFGWADAGWHRSPAEQVEYDVVTPTMNELVREGVELNRHYVFRMCTPTRSSFQSGRLPVHVLIELAAPCDKNGAIPKEMTGIAQVMKKAGYATHQVGKWDAGMATPKHTPKGRGYDTSLTYYGHGNWMWTHAEWSGGSHNTTNIFSQDGAKCVKDLWDTDRPASSSEFVGSGYEEYLFRNRMHKIITEHDASVPLFLNYDSRLTHYPLQAPLEYQMRFQHIENKYRRLNHAMANFLDDQLRNATTAMRTKGMWDNTLMILSSDNGGPVLAEDVRGEGCKAEPALPNYSPNNQDQGHGWTCFNGEAGANNFPLRGGKYCRFEGGIRVNAFVSGGWKKLDPVRGTKNEGMIHIADWYGTLATLAGVEDYTDHSAAAAGLPPVDSVDVMPLILGQNTTSPRTSYFVEPGLLVTTKWKLSTGQKSLFGAAQGGPAYPNMTSVNDPVINHNQLCPNEVCLFDLENDLYELHEVSQQNPEVVEALTKQLAKEQESFFSVSHKQDPACKKYAYSHYGGYYGPWLDLNETA